MSKEIYIAHVSRSLTQFTVFIIIIFALGISGCSSGELSRSQVKLLVEAFPDFVQPATVDLTNQYETKSSCTERLSAEETVEQAKARDLKTFLESYPTIGVAYHLGYTQIEQTLVKEDKYFPANTFASPCWRLTIKFRAGDKGKQLWEVLGIPIRDDALPIGRKHLGVVTGITKQGETQALADFTYQWQPNEFGKALDEKTEEFKKLPVEIQKSLTEKKGLLHVADSADWSGERQGKSLFQKYDDGWRLVRIF
jgi:hypothetical protein